MVLYSVLDSLLLLFLMIGVQKKKNPALFSVRPSMVRSIDLFREQFGAIKKG